MADAQARLCDQCRRKHMRVVQGATLRILRPRTLESTSLGAAGQSKDRLIIDIFQRPAEAEGVAITFRAVEIDLGIESRGGFQKACCRLEVWRCPGQILSRNQRQDLLRKRADPA